MGTHGRVRLIAIATMLVGLLGSGVLTSLVASSVGRHELSYTDRAEDGDPPQVALGIALGAFRGIYVNYLWIKANTAKEEGQYFKAVDLSRQITTLQPRFPRVWSFHAWNLSYNISVTTETPEERWEWVNSGVRLLRDEGLRANPNDMLMHRELGWIFLHKIAGYTDDANQYYKRQHAYEWHSLMGPPPELLTGERDRESVIRAHTEALEPIVAAPASMAGLRESSPAAAEILDAYEDRIGEGIGFEFLRRYTVRQELERAGQLAFTQGRMGPKTAAFLELREEFSDQSAWDDALAFVRRRVLVDDYNMEPVRMVQIVQKFGPADWRLPSAHALYWAARGTDVGRMEVTDNNADALDFVNAYRVVLQSVQDLWRFGTMYFNYLDIHQQRNSGIYFVAPNEYFVPTYGSMLREVVDNSGRYESDSQAMRTFSSGYENFLRDAVRYFYRRGDEAQAEYWFSVLRNWPGQNINDPDRIFEMSLPLAEFAEKQLFESYSSPQVAVSEVRGALEGAFLEGLLIGDVEKFEGLFEYARKAHAFFMREQLRTTVSGADAARMEFMDRDFTFEAGGTLTQVIGQLAPVEAELLYSYAPEDLRRYAYEAINIRFRGAIDALAAQGESEPFDVLFPEPPGMEAHRELIARKRALREQRSVEGLDQD